jgi:type IV secretory pathway TraG/TraD family ATPase VirD4
MERLNSGETASIQNLVTMIVDPDGKGLEDHWAKTAHSLIVGCITHLLYVGSDDIIRQAFNTEPKDNDLFVPGMMSRKKQLIPTLTALWG